MALAVSSGGCSVRTRAAIGCPLSRRVLRPAQHQHRQRHVKPGHPVPSHAPASRCTVCRARTDQDESATDTSAAPELRDAPASTSDRLDAADSTGTPHMPYGVISVLAGAGALETAYLTWAKLTDTQVACTADGGCTTVLGSEYATVLGIPLPLLGFLAYGTVAGLAVSGWLASEEGSEQQGDWRRQLVLAGAAVLASCSATLMYVLFTKLDAQSCTWCFASAALSASIALAACRGFRPRELREAALPGGGLVAATVLLLLFAWSGIDGAEAQADINIPYQVPIVTSSSTTRSVQLAKRLRDAGARMYGAFWCSHCQDQKETFGRDAMGDFPYVECYPEGYFKGVKLAQPCIDAKIQAFPVWVIGGKQYEGEQSLDKLDAALKSAEGSRPSSQMQAVQ